MNRLLPIVLAVLTFLAPAAPARTVVVTNANNEKSVTLAKGDTLVVRLASNPSTGFSWSVVYDPNGPLAPLGKTRYTPAPHPPHILGGGGTAEFRFTVLQSADSGEGEWLRLLYLRPFAPGVKDAQLWEINCTVQGTAKAAK